MKFRKKVNYLSLIVLILLQLGILFYSNSIFASQNYKSYHKIILKAETHIAKKEFEKAIVLYDSAFGLVKKPFLREVVCALQIAYIANNKKYQNKFLIEAFKNGLNINALKRLYFFKNKIDITDTIIKREYAKYRKIYLSSINLKLKKQLKQNFEYDEINKLTNKNIEEYCDILNSNLNYLKLSLDKGTFPSESLVGVTDEKQFMPDNRLLQMCRDQQLQMYNNHLMIIFFHNPCAFSLFKNEWSKMIENGTMHPRDVAVVYDFQFPDRGVVFNKNFKKCNIIKDYKFEITSYEPPYLRQGEGRDKEDFINKCRDEFYIQKLDTDKLLRKIEDEYKINIRFGFEYNPVM